LAIAGFAATCLSLANTVQAQTVAYATRPWNDDVVVIDTTDNSIQGSPIPVGGFPDGISITPDGRFAYVANQSSDTVSVIDLSERLAVAEIQVGTTPVRVAFSPDGSLAYVANRFSHSVSLIDTGLAVVSPGSAVVDTIDLLNVPADKRCTQPYGIDVSNDGRFAYMNCWGSSVGVIDTATRQLLPTIFGTFGSGLELAVSPDGATVYATATPYLAAIDTSSNTVTARIPLASGGFLVGVALSPDGARAYVTSSVNHGSVFVIDTETHRQVADSPIRLPQGDPRGIDFTPDGKFAYVAHNTGGINVSVINTETNSVVQVIDFGPGVSGADIAIVPLTAVQRIQTLIVALDTLAAQLVLNKGQGTALISVLEAAITSLENGKYAALPQLLAFVKQVQALKNSGVLPESEADALIAEVQHVVNQLFGG